MTKRRGRFEHLRFQNGIRVYEPEGAGQDEDHQVQAVRAHGQGCVQTALLQAVRVLALALSSSTTGATRPTETCITNQVAIYQDPAMKEWAAPWFQRAA